MTAEVPASWLRLAGPSIDVTNPATGELIARVPKAGREETAAAITQAQKALPGWSARTAKERAAILRRWHDLIVANVEDLARILTAEQGKPRSSTARPSSSGSRRKRSASTAS